MCLGLLENSWVMSGHILGVNMDSGPWWQNSHFSLSWPKTVQHNNYLEMHLAAGFLLLAVVAWYTLWDF